MTDVSCLVFLFLLLKDQGGLGIAISEDDTLNGVIIKSLTEHGIAAKVRLYLTVRKW